MAQIDRQTDKAIHWKSAIFDCSGSDNWEKLNNLPAFVKEVHRQKEVCPSTNNEHYQVHVVCHRQVTWKQMANWIKYTKWIAVKGAEHIANSLNYCRKKESAVEGTFEIQKGEKYLRIHELLLAIGKALRPSLTPYPIFIGSTSGHEARVLRLIDEWEKQFVFKNAARKIIQKEGLIWIDKLSNPVVEKMWNYFHKEILQEIEKAEGEGGFIIEPPSPQGRG